MSEEKEETKMAEASKTDEPETVHPTNHGTATATATATTTDTKSEADHNHNSPPNKIEHDALKDVKKDNALPGPIKMKRANTCPLPSTPSLPLPINHKTPTPSSAKANASANSKANTNSNGIVEPMEKEKTNPKALARSQSDRGVVYQGQGQGIDAHPYARGSVIEVLYGVSTKSSLSIRTEAGGDGEYDDYEDEDEFDDEDEFEEETRLKNVDTTNSQDQDGDGTTNTTMQDIRLADIIDRAPSKTPEHTNPCYRWKYYIHYREYNRRMDEWITDPTRIISPPSVGNAKVRAIKKAKAAKVEEERRAREREKREREQAEALAEIQGKRRKGMDGEDVGGAGFGIGVDGNSTSPLGRPVSQRASSRRASKAIAASSSHTLVSSTASQSGQDGIDASMDEQERLRLTRSQRRKSTRGSGGDDSEDVDKKKNLTSDEGNGMTVTTLLPDDKMIQDKVVTVAAQELDEHEGLDEASLREHEEVTKVKNVNEVELGRYRMVSQIFGSMMPIASRYVQIHSSNF
jgi:hypothetical protein